MSDQAPTWVRVRYDPTPDMPRPIFVLERLWHQGTAAIIPRADLTALDGIPGFTEIGTTDPPPAPRRG